MKWAVNFVVNRFIVGAVVLYVVNNYTRDTCDFGFVGGSYVERLDELTRFKILYRALAEHH